ncbi:DUF2846 domain-containing protein [Stenotrophobium rhamnosiphilum]|uniref:DUF2846 domain-containing protein n=1 Tax=Stenotrophobium rhamnosiphilum TaxID=2029166 RepID=A0A2T5MF86_9GAMM|nr:DUF2846 domain-containing protein [Stenotrophobium rhamnosiphilum]PTU31226.1 hypothetical protein CJD38_07690 [Stenotrophobium rhamnosiphilum]
MQNHFKLFVTGLAMALVSACSSVPLASSDADAAAKKFEPTPGKVNFYIYRHEIYGDDRSMAISIDGKVVGHTRSCTYVLKTVEPGIHTITSQEDSKTDLKIENFAGQNQFIWIEVVTGLVPATSALHPVDATTGQTEIERCKLVR